MKYKNMTFEEEREEAIKLLDDVLRMQKNEDRIGTIANNLLHLVDCRSIDILEEFFDRATLLHHYGVLTFIIDEGYVRNCAELMPLLKHIHLLQNEGHDYWILERYIELIKTKEDMKYVVDRLIGKVKERLLPNLYWGVGYMSDSQLEILASFDQIDGYPLYLFSKKITKNIDFFKKEILNKDKFYQDIVFLSAFTKGFSDNELSELIDIADNDDLKSWYCLSPTRPVAPNTKKVTDDRRRQRKLK